MNLKARKSYSGFTLIELLISITIGLVILAAVMAVGSRMLQANNNMLKSSKLNQELSNVLQIMANELRRAGYSGGDRDRDPDNPPDPPIQPLFGDNDPWGPPPAVYGDGAVDVLDVTIPDVSADPNIDSCILYAYDEDEDGVLDASEQRGFRLRDNAIEVRRSCSAAGCDTDCSIGTGTWEDITLFVDQPGNLKDQGIKVTKLEFNTEGSKCLNVESGDYWYIQDDSDVSGLPCFEISASETVTLCSDGTDLGADIDPNTECADGNRQTPASGERTVEVRQIKIVLEGELGHDASVKKTLTTSVKIANHQMVQQP